MNIEQIYRDFNVPYATEGHKHCRPGWVNTACPFCTGNPGLHLGYNTDGDYYVCWRGCKGLYPVRVLSSLLNVTKQQAGNLMRQYGSLTRKAPETKRKIRNKAFKLPNNSNELFSNHIKYLTERNFDPEQLVKEWDLKGTGPSALLDKINYKHRIIIPFYWDNEIVSFDSRDISNKHKNKYQACPLERELIPHKDILYGNQTKWKETGICVEGPSDVWRLGPTSFATSGIKYTNKQVRLISKSFKRVFVVFDDDPQAIKQDQALTADLKFRGIETIIIDIEGDPGGMDQKEADYLVKHLMK